MKAEAGHADLFKIDAWFKLVLDKSEYEEFPLTAFEPTPTTRTTTSTFINP